MRGFGFGRRNSNRNYIHKNQSTNAGTASLQPAYQKRKPGNCPAQNVQKVQDKQMTKIFVTTPTGNIGSVVVDGLLGQADVSVLARNPNKLTPEVREAATVHQGDIMDEATVQKATEGADALFWLTPPDFHIPDWKAAFEQSARVVSHAVKTNKIGHVVYISSGGADRQGFGPVSFLHIVENAISETGANALHLRPGYFYENFFAQIDPIKHMGKVFFPFGPDVRYPMIATRDIGDVAARRLLARDFSGVEVLGLHGPKQVPSFGEAAQIIGEAIGKPVEFVQIPIEAFKGQLQQIGASQSVVDNYAELMQALERGEQPLEPRTDATTTPTTLSEWAKQVLAPAVNG
jgi:uncharacterized protein YbjT (DUF2867 family)